MSPVTLRKHIKKNTRADILNIKTVKAEVCNLCTTKQNYKNNDCCQSGHPNTPRICHLVEQTVLSKQQNNEDKQIRVYLGSRTGQNSMVQLHLKINITHLAIAT